MSIRCAALITACSLFGLTFGNTAHAEEPDSFFVDASVEELEEGGYILYDLGDTSSLHNVLEEGAYQEQLWLESVVDRLIGLGMAQEAAALAELAAFAGLESFGLDIVEFMPDASAPSSSDPYTSGGWNDGPLAATFPTGQGLVGLFGDWNTVPTTDGGSIHTRVGTQTDGSRIVQSVVQDPGGHTASMTTIVDRPNGSGSCTRREWNEDGSSSMRSVETDAEDNVVKVTKEKYEAGEVPPPEENPDVVDEDVPAEPQDVAGYQPAQGGEGSGYCPVFIASCQLMAEEIADDLADPYRIISGYVFVNPGPDGGTETPPANQLQTNSVDLVWNPDPDVYHTGKGGPAPSVRHVSLPVLVLPPKPNL